MASTSAAEPSSATKESPNWVEMPDEVMVKICKRLPSVEVLKSVRKVCRTWGRICKYPAMWKVINMLKRPVDNWDRDWDLGLKALTKEAVDLSCGELIDISIEWFATEELLDHIVLHSSQLKCLCLVRCFRITGGGLSRAVKSVAHLKKLHIFYISNINAEDIEVIGRNCPQLQSFKMRKNCSRVLKKCDDYALAIANNMPELRHLDLYESGMTNDGLEAILNGCPHLQSLDVRQCHHLKLGGDLGKLCMEQIKHFKHGSTQNCGFYDDGDFFEENMDDDFYDSED